MADLIDLGGVPSWINANFITFMVFASLAAIALILWIFLNRKYPKILFIIRENGPFRFLEQRLDGNQIVGSNLLMLFLAKKTIGEDIRKFDRIPFEFHSRMTAKVIGVYWGELVRGAIVPLRIKIDAKKCARCNMLIHVASENDGIAPVGDLICKCVDDKGKPNPTPIAYIIPDEVNDGRTVALTYVEAMDTVEKETKSHEPVQIALITIAMIAIPIGIFVLAVFLIQGNYNTVVNQIADKLIIVSQNLASIHNVSGVVP